MKSKSNRKYVRNITKLRRTQGCLTDCVAYFLNLHPEKVPFFIYPRKGWNDRLKKFFKIHGYKMRWNYCLTPPRTGTHIVCGNSLVWKTACHVVVYKNGKLVFDPDYPSRWKDNRITHKMIIEKIK